MAETSFALVLLGILLTVVLGILLPKKYQDIGGSSFTYLSHFPYELARNGYPEIPFYLKELASSIVMGLSTVGGILALASISLGYLGNATLVSLAVVGMVFLLAAGTFTVMTGFHSDLVNPKRHLVFFFVEGGCTAVASAIAGILLLQFYRPESNNFAMALAFSIVLFVLAVIAIAPFLFVNLAKGTHLEEVIEKDGTISYVRPKKNPLVISEWLVLVVELLSALVTSGAAIYIATAVENAVA